MFRLWCWRGLFVAVPALAALLIVGQKWRNEGSGTRGRTAASRERIPHFGAPATVKDQDLLVSNGDCLVCHPSLAKELISDKHLKRGIGCRHCHGDSADHMQDEMQMTRPDFLYGRNEIDPFCKVCHPAHECPEKVEAFFREWRGKDRPNGRVVAENSICTDCHGEHNIRKEKATGGEKREAELAPLFDGKSLTGWAPAGQATWTVENGAIVGRQGPNGAGGELLSTGEYKDFLLAVTYKVEWPAAGGVWLRYQSPDKALRAAIIESANPPQYSGTLYDPSQKSPAANANKELVNRDGWNTLSIKAQGGQIEVFLNGNPAATARDVAADGGKIGLHIAPGAEFARMKLTVREVLLRKTE